MRRLRDMSEVPAIVLVAPEHSETLLQQFTRYRDEYALFVARDLDEAGQIITELGSNGNKRLALVVTESQVAADGTPEAPHDHHQGLLATLSGWRDSVPTSRRLVVAHRSRFPQDSGVVRPLLASGLLDAYLLLPSGPRDEEFHGAVTELLSDWGATVPDPEVEVVQLAALGDEPVTREIREFLDRSGLPYGVHHPDSPIGAEILAEWTTANPGAAASLPVVRAPFRKILMTPSSAAELASYFYGRPTDLPEDLVLDLIIVGAGPAGLAAAVYGASEGLRVLAVEAEVPGGQAGTSSMIRNYLGFPRGISGMRLAQRAINQAARFGAWFFSGSRVTDLRVGGQGEPFVLVTDRGEVRGRSVVVASGVRYRRLGVPEIEALVGRGVFYGSAMTAAREMSDVDVVVVGGGNSAGQAALHLARFARSVTIVIRRASLAETMSQYLINEIDHNARVSVQARSAVVAGGGPGRLDHVTIRHLDTGVDETRDVGGLFLLLGAEPGADWLPPQVARDDYGFVLTGRDVPRQGWCDGLPPESLETSVSGVFAVGDIRSGSMKRVASASGEGASVIPLVHTYLTGD